MKKIHLEVHSSSVPDSGPDSDFDSDSGLYKNLFLKLNKINY